MSGPKVGTNLKRLPPRAQTNRPGGCSAFAESDHPSVLYFAAENGNRATRRVARRKLLKIMKGGRR